MHTSIKKLVITGDSLVDDSSDYYKNELRTTRWTTMISEQIDAECINTGISGDTVTYIADHIDERVLNYNPTHVIFDGGINDIVQGIREDMILSSIEFLFTVLFEEGIKIIYFFSPCVSVQDSNMPYTSQYMQLYQKIISLVQRYSDVGFVDLCLTELGGIGSINTDYYGDNIIHYNQNGEAIVAREILNFIEGKYAIKGFEDNNTMEPEGQIFVGYRKRLPLYVQVGGQFKPVTLRPLGTVNDTEVVTNIKWRC